MQQDELQQDLILQSAPSRTRRKHGRGIVVIYVSGAHDYLTHRFAISMCIVLSD
jgi:hypothetical protein